MHASRQLLCVVIVCDVVFHLEILDELLRLIHQLLLVYLLVTSEFLVLLPQVSAEMPEYRASVDEFKLLPLVLVRNFTGALFRATVAAN